MKVVRIILWIIDGNINHLQRRWHHATNQLREAFILVLLKLQLIHHIRKKT